jgi:hypothetical protein
MAEEKWVVLATRLFTLHPNGKGDPRRQKKHFRGDVLTGLSEDDVRRFTKARAIAPYGDDEAKAAQVIATPPHPSELSVADALAAVPTQTDAPAPAAAAEQNAGASPGPTSIVSISDGAEQVSRPPKSATKDKLVAYAVKSGQMTEEQALATSRNDLRDKLK